jgi:hypothetical protein
MNNKTIKIKKKYKGEKVIQVISREGAEEFLDSWPSLLS